MSLPVRRPGARRPGQPRGLRPARASARRASAARALALATLVAAGAALYGVTTSPAFAVGPGDVVVDGARFTDRATILAALGVTADGRRNVFGLHSADLVAALRALPAVDASRGDAVTVSVALPHALRVTLVERSPIAVWRAGGARFLFDVEGTFFVAAPEEGPAADALAALPQVDETRAGAGAVRVGDRLDPLELAAVRRLAAITPAFLGSAATGLRLAVSDDEGFTIDAEPSGWHAVFGIYTPTVRPPSIIDAQVRCLASLLAGREATLATIVLAPQPGGEGCGTYTLRAAS